jgi:hypothetical protein
MHNHDDKNNKLMWWMIIPCLLLLGFLFFGGSKLSSSSYLWSIFIGVFVIAHIWMMLRGHGGHGGHSNTNTEEKIDNTVAKQPEAEDEDNKYKNS